MSINSVFNNSIGQGYRKLSNYLAKADVNDFKQNDNNFNYAIEHNDTNSIKFGYQLYNYIIDSKMLTLEQIKDLLELNDKIGNPLKTDKISNKIPACNPNSLKYIYFGLLVIKHITKLKIDNLNFIEIGGGYGGQCLILLKLFEIFNINVKKYILIDLREVVDFQKKYITAHNLNHLCEFLPYDNYSNYNFENDCYVFSCYSFNEVLPSIRQNYYSNLFPFTNHGSFIWPTKNTDLPMKYNKISLEDFGDFITF